MLPIIGFGQKELPVKEGKVIYEYIDSSLSNTGTDLYNRSKLWAAEAFKNSRQVIQVDEKETGLIMGKGNFTFTQTMTDYIVRFSFRINVKDGKYRIQFYDITSQQDTQLGRELTAEKLNEKSGSGKIKDKINSRFNSLIDQYRAAIIKKSDNSF